MNLNFRMKHKILYLVLSAVLAALVSSNSQEYTRIHIEFPNIFVAEYEKSASQDMIYPSIRLIK